MGNQAPTIAHCNAMANTGHAAFGAYVQSGHSLGALKWVLEVFPHGMTGSEDMRSAANIKAIPTNWGIIGLVICGPCVSQRSAVVADRRAAIRANASGGFAKVHTKKQDESNLESF